MSPLAELAASIPFPGRMRQFAAPDPGQALALAVGAAWAELPRGGHAAAVVPAARRREPLVQEALALAGRLALPNLSILGTTDPGVACEPLAASDRQPVRLPSLGRDLVPRWGESTPAAALAATALREPLLLLPEDDPRWGVGRAALLALAWIAGDGRRVAWALPPGTDLSAWDDDLTLIGLMQLPLKLLIAPADLPWPPAERGLERWWVTAPGRADAAGVLAWALAGEECVVAALPATMTAGEAWIPGAPRWLERGPSGTRLCLGDDDPPAGHGLLRLVGLVPLPVAELAAAPRPLSTASEDLARHLAPLASLYPGLRCVLAPAANGPQSPR